MPLTEGDAFRRLGNGSIQVMLQVGHATEEQSRARLSQTIRQFRGRHALVNGDPLLEDDIPHVETARQD